MKVLLLDADQRIGRALEPELDGAELFSAASLSEGLSLIVSRSWDLILLDADFSGAGLEILVRLREDSGMAPVVLLTALPTMDLAIEAIWVGAHDVVPKPLPRGRVREILLGLNAVKRLRPLPEVPNGGKDVIVGASPQMMGVVKAVARAAPSDATVLVLGESGTGKEMVARLLHSRSRRSRGPWRPPYGWIRATGSGPRGHARSVANRGDPLVLAQPALVNTRTSDGHGRATASWASSASGR